MNARLVTRARRRPACGAVRAMTLAALVSLCAAAPVGAQAPVQPSATTDAAPLAQDPGTLRFGRIAAPDAGGPAWRPLLDGLATRGAPALEEATFASADAVLEAIRFDRVDVAVLPAAVASDAVARAGAAVFAATTPLSRAEDTRSLLVTGKDGPATLADALRCDKSLRIAMGTGDNPLMTTVPGYFLFARNQVAPRTCFRSAEGNRASRNLDDLAADKVDLALATDGTLRSFVAANPVDGTALRVLWQGPALPPDVLVWRTDLDPARRNALFHAVFTFGRAGQPEQVSDARTVLTAIGTGQFALATDTILLPLQQIELFRRQRQVADDDTLSDGERQRRTTELAERLLQLQALEPEEATGTSH
ncbi:PhnD/SsuA/transferrin family substrate-binding protein [Zavarzinia sp. CC-PAN008]|uniref:PhnD/SsuA/transferrin family substrate-binding protein n=1 Tax=Zavarzinia sp. CC-PAN008 TaxID=3243332 RepID=UPI003F746939